MAKVAAKPRAKTPTILQIESVECGAACLAIVLAYHGRYETLETLRAACGVSRDGSKAGNICRAARDYGFFARGYKKEPEDLRQIEPPMIIFWEFNHFVVVEGFGDGIVYLNDPASGPRKVTDEEFSQSFTGIVLAFEKNDDFKPGGAARGVWPALRRRLSGSAWGLLYVILSTTLLVLPGIVTPVLSRVFVDACLVGGMKFWTGPVLLAMVACGLTMAVAAYLQQSSLLRLETRMSLAGSSRFFWHVLRLPTAFFAQRAAGEVGYRVDINQRLATLLGGQLATNVVNAMLAALYVGLMIQYDALLTGLSLGIAALNIVALRFAARRRSDHSQRMQQDQGKLMGVAIDGLRTIESLKASGEESSFFSRWAGHHAKVANAEQDLGAATQWLAVVPPALAALNLAAILSIGGLRVMDGVMTMGMLVALQSLTSGFLTPVNRLVTLGGRMQEVRGDLNRVEDALRNPVMPGLDVEADSGEAPERPRGHVELRNVTFGYSRLDPPLIRGFSLTVPAGSRVALVGGSGSGKSTVAKLVSGISEPWTGEVLFDGVPRSQWSRRALADSVAVVDQDIMLFEGTVRDNIVLWDNTVEEAAMIRAAKDAVLHDDIAARPGGYAYKVEEGGWNFSGGQRQRIEIARALTIDPRILILDEATSALDPRTERLLDENLRRRGCTCIIVAHRLSTVRDCDEIVVLERGVVVERGTHDELVRKGGAYAKLIRSH